MTNDLNYLFKTKILVSLRDGKYLFFHQSEFCLPGWVLHNIKIFLEHWFFGYCVIWCRYLIYVWCINMYDNYICSSSLHSSMNTRHFNHLWLHEREEQWKKAESWRFLITINIITLSHSCSGISGPAQPGQEMLHLQIKQNIARLQVSRDQLQVKTVSVPL